MGSFLYKFLHTDAADFGSFASLSGTVPSENVHLGFLPATDAFVTENTGRSGSKARFTEERLPTGLVVC